MNPSEITEDTILTSHQAGALLQVNPSSIINWVKAGRIEAFRTPGGHWRIKVNALLSFLKTHNMPIPRGLAAASRRRILIVDDDELHLSGMGRFFRARAEKVEVELANNGIDALLRVGSFKPHLIVLDVIMPEVDGLEVCRRLKTNPQTSGIDIIIASGQLTKEVQEKAEEAGAKRCMQKPLNLQVILEDLGVSVT